jgi:hypothetical protein
MRLDTKGATPQGQPPIPTDPETEEHLFEVVATIFAMPIRRVGGLSTLRLVRIRPVEQHGRGVLMQPGRRDGIDFQGFQGDRTKHLVEIGRTQRIKDMPQAVIIEGGPREPRLQQRHHPALFQPLPHLIEGMMPIQNGQHQGFDPTPTREPMGRVRRDEAIDKRGDLQAS